MRRIVGLLVAAVLLGGCGQQAGSTIATGATPAPPATPHDPRAITVRAVERVLTHARLPSGSRTATAREARGKELQTSPADKNLVDRHATYVVPLGYPEAIAWFTGHAPPHLESVGSSRASGPDGRISTGVEFDGRPTLSYDELAEQVAIYPLDDTHTVVRVDGLAVWLPRPTADERVPAGADAVHVVRVVRGGAAPQRFTLTGSAVHRLARVINQQRPIGNAVFNCPNDTGAYDVLHFTGATPDPTFRVPASGCGVIDVTTDGVTQPPLNGGFGVDRVLRELMTRRGQS